MKSKLKKAWKRILKTLMRTEMRVLPGQLAFFVVLSVIPLLALFGSIASGFGITAEAVTELLTSILPTAALDLLLPLITGKDMNFNIAIFYISAFILASNGTHSMIITSNAIYKFKDKDYLSRRIKALIMTVVLVFLMVFVILVPAFGTRIVTMICDFLGNEMITKNLLILFNILKYPLSFFMIYFCVKLLYVMAPDETIKSVNTTVGSMFTSIGWMIATEVYSIYVDVFARYNLFYGSLSNILILLLWIYMLSFIFVFGMALNAGYREDTE